MADHISDLDLFCQIVAAGSLTRAALNLNSSPPAVSRRLAAMEARLGVRLIERNARRFRLTEEGSLLHERALRILADIEEAELEATSHVGRLAGWLRIGAHQQAGRERLGPLVARFGERHADLKIELVLSNAPLDLVEDGLDILLQIEKPTSGQVVARKLTSHQLVLYASPEYLDRRGRPKKPDDLLEHDCLCLKRGRLVLDRWPLVEDGETREIQVSPRLVSSSSEVIDDWAVAGYGIGLNFRWSIQEDLDAGRLEECLQGFNGMTLDLHAIYAYRRYQPPKITAFLDYLSEEVESAHMPPRAFP